ncbi:MAG: DegV family protein [Ruminococcus sp.]
MNKIAVVTDTNSGMPREEAEKLGVTLIPMPFMVDDNEYFEGVTCTYEHFFEMLAEEKNVSTSQPDPFSITKTWDKLLETHDGIIYLPMSSALSGSCQSARALAADYGEKVYVADNKRISFSLYEATLDAVELAGQGLSPREIGEILEKKGLDSSIYLAVNTLTLLKKSGRVTAAGAALATILGLKPVLQIQGEKLDAYAKVRGMKAAEKAMFEAIEKDADTRFKGKKLRIGTAYSGSDENGREWVQLVREHFGDNTIKLHRLPISICCHVGDGVRAIGCIPLD